MAEFDPDAYLRSPTSVIDAAPPAAAFDPDKYLAGGAPDNRSWYDRVVGGLEAARNTLDPATTGIVRGIPIVGPWLDKAAMGAAALPSAAIPGASVAGSYNQLVRENAQRQAEHPISNVVGQLTGGIISTVPVARAVPLAFGGNSFLGQTAASAALGGTDAASRSAASPGGFNMNDVYWGAGIGAGAPAMGSVFAPIGQGIAAAGRGIMKMPGLRSFSGRIVPPGAPAAGETDVLETAANEGYRRLNSLYRYDPAAIDDLSQLIKSDLYHGNTATAPPGSNIPTGGTSSKSAAIGAVQTHAILNSLDTLPPTPGALHTVRKALGEVAKQGGDEGASAAFAIKRIDNFFEQPPPNAIVFRDPANPANANAHQILQDANGNWKAMKNSAEWNQLRANAAQEAQNANMLMPSLVEGQIIRRKAKDLLASKNRSQYLGAADSPERSAVEDVASAQSVGQGILDSAGRLSQTARLGMGSIVSLYPWLLGGALDTVTGPALVAGGVGANLASTGLTRQAAQRADDVIRSQAPEAHRLMAPRMLGPNTATTPFATLTNPALNPSQFPASLNAFQHRNEITRLMMLQAEQQRQALMGGGP